MYTNCPECRTAFRVTVTVLRKAHGRVRCGGCGHVFDAIENLHDEATRDETAIGATGVRQRFVEQSEELLKSLDELAGPDEIRIEDTGVEWRVFDADDESADDDGAGDESAADVADDPDATGSVRWHFAAGDDDQAGDADDEAGDTRNFDLRTDTGEEMPAAADGSTQAQADLDLELDDEEGEERAGRPADEIRYDDNTPLPDEETDHGGNDDDAADATPKRRAEDWQPPPLAHDLQVDLALGEPDDWQALLEEVATDGADGAGAAQRDDGPAAAGGAAENDLTAAAATDSGAADPDAAAAAEARRTANWTLVDDAGADHTSRPAVTDGASAGDASPQPDDVSFEAAAEQQLDAALAEAATGTDAGDDGDPASINMQIDQDLLRAVAEGSESQSGRHRAPDTSASSLFETIVMEGDSIRDTEDDDEDDSKASDAGTIAVASLEHAAASSPESAGDDEPAAAASTWPRVAAAIALCLLLGGQLVHANRATLATWDSFDRMIGPVYRVLGQTVTPEWNIRGWQFESTSGSADAADEILTIRSRIANRSEQPLPLPLVHVSLTDRYEEIIGSRLLEPAEYLPESTGTDRPIAPGGAFTAEITVASPSAAATGFKLNVCYPFGGEKLRCAIEAFRD